MIYKTILLAAIILMGYLVVPSYAQSAPEQALPGASPFSHQFTDVKFLDAYFGYQNQKIEVQPGDKNVPFTMVFANVGTEDITGIDGSLDMPMQFSPATSAGGIIEADNTQTAAAGSSFTLTFYLNVDKSLVVHNYSGTAKLTYSLVRENGLRQAFFDFNFKLTGKGLLNMKADNPFLQPASNNQVTVQVSNAGTAGLNNVDITLNPQTNASDTGSNLQNVVIDQRHWNVGTVSAGSSSSYSFNIFVTQDLAGQTLHIPFAVTYFDGQGNQISNTRTVDLIVGPATTSVIKLSTPSYIMMGVMQNLTLGLQNTSPSKISNISITVTPNSQDFKILQDNKWFIQTINPLESSAVQIPVFADQNIQDQAVNFNVNMQYTKDGSTVIETQSFATYIRPVIDVSVYGVQVSEIASQQMIIGNVLNQGNVKGQFAIATIDPLEGSTIKKATQYIGDLDIDAPTPFNMPVQSTTGELSGDQKVLVTLTYKDTLLQPNTITQVDTVSFGTPAPQSDGSFSQLQLVILVAIAAGIGGIVFKIKKKPKVPVEEKAQEAG
ncbi:MAG: COG1361 S-layer family protein [Nitrosotalea sp.]